MNVGPFGHRFETHVGQLRAMPLLQLFDVLIKTFFVLILLGGDWLEFLFDRMG